MKCRVCRGPAVIDLPAAQRQLLRRALPPLCRDQVAKAIAEPRMIDAGERVLVAVSGGKDSLALWDLLLDLGYDADGLYLGLGIGELLRRVGPYARAFADGPRPRAPRGRPARRPRLRRARRRPPSPVGCRARRAGCRSATCSTGGRDGGYDVVATGHNLDDEAAVLLGNVLRWDVEYLARQLPGAAGARRLPPQGEAARPPDRAGDGGLLRPARASTTSSRSARWRPATGTSATRRR